MVNKLILFEGTLGASDIASKLQNSVYEPLKTVATAIAIIAIVGCGLAWLFSPDPRAAEKAKTGLIAAVGALALIYFAPSIVNMIISAFGG